MSRIVSVCLCAVVAVAALTGAPFFRPAAVLAASGTLSMETPLHEAPDPAAPLVALLTEGVVVSIDGPPVDGFYPVTVGNLSGWMRGETLQLEKDPLGEEAATDESWQETNGVAPIEQTADGTSAPIETATELDPATDPAMTTSDPPADQGPAAEPPVENSGENPELSEPASDATYDDQSVKDANPEVDTSATTDGSAQKDAPAAVEEPVQVDETALVEDPAPVDPVAAPAAEVDSGKDASSAGVAPDGSPPPADPAASADGDSPEVAVEPAADPNVTPVPAAESAPVGPASVTVDAPIRAGPGPGFDLIFTVPMGSTLEQTGHVIDGYVTAQYKEVTGWVALDELGPPSAFVEEPPPGEPLMATPTPPAEPPPAETPPAETPPAETPPAETPPAEAAPVAAAPIQVKTPRPGSGVAYTTVDMSLRNGPSATEQPVTVVPAGSRVVLTGVMEGGFQRVTYKDDIGWIADEYLQSPENPEPEIGRHGNPEFSRKEIIRIINNAADRYGQSRSDMLRVAECESNLNPYAVNPSGSYGLFQFIRSTWKSTPYGNKDVFDPEANANAAAWMWSEGRKSEWVCQ